MKKFVIILAILPVFWLVASAGAGSNLFDHNLVSAEFSSTAKDTTLDGKVLRVTKTNENLVPCSVSCEPLCSNAFDDDGDGKIDYPADPGCTSSADEDEWNPAPPPPPAPPPAPPPPPEWQWTLMDSNPPDYIPSSYDECQSIRVPCLMMDPLTIRCKIFAFTLKPHEGHFGIDFGPAFKYDGGWRICYRPFGGGITEVSYRYGDATDTYGQWEWRGNDTGYPSHIREEHRVYVRYGGGAAICIGGTQGCGPERHFRLTFTFTDSGKYGSITKTVNYL